MEDEVLSMTLHAAAARTAVANGSPTEARLAIARVNRMRPRVTAILPIPALQMRFETIRAYLVLRDAAAAQDAARGGQGHPSRVPGPGDARPGGSRAGTVGGVDA